MTSTAASLRERIELRARLDRRAAEQRSLLTNISRDLKISLEDFVEATAGITLDDWQRHYCRRLERLRWEKGQRILLHAPPQMGKSVVVSQRLTPYLVGHIPTLRVKLACYNIERAKKHTKLARNIMTSDSYRRIFPSPEVYVDPTSPEKEWFTAARLAKMDGQASMLALGLVTGFVGEGADLLIIDDPYASPEQARSKLENKKICDFYPEVANVRITDETNVIVMFHRYTENDLAASLLSGPEEWEYLRYAAIADGDYLYEPTKRVYLDPMGRSPGEYLSPRRKPSWYESQAKNVYVWNSQFQGRPSPKEGTMYIVSCFGYVDKDAIPGGLKSIRSWDLAATAGDGDFTVGILGAGPDADGFSYVRDVKRGQWSVETRNKIILDTALADGVNTKITLPLDPGQAGIDQQKNFMKLLAGFPVIFRKPTGDKVTRAEASIAAVNNSAYKLVRAPWNYDFVDELRGFPLSAHDDQVDAFADNHNERNNRKIMSYA